MEQFTITKEWLLNNRTARGGYTKQQASILLQTWPLKKGWQKKVIGNKIIIGMKIEFENSNKPNKTQTYKDLPDNYYVFVINDDGAWDQHSINMTLLGAESFIASKRYGNRYDNIYCIMQRLNH